MYKVTLLAFLFGINSVVCAQNFGGNPAWQKWQQLQNTSGKIIFAPGADSQARRILFINQLLNQTTLHTIGNKVLPWNIVLLHQSTLSNAYVRLAPVISEFYMTPSQNNFSIGSLRWDDNLVIHENRHMQQFANFNKGFTKVFSFLLGQQGQLLANGIAIPNYFFEGDAVWQETLVSQQGRGRMPYFFNGLKSLWLSNTHYSWMKLRSGSFKDYVPDHYELGYPLIAYGYQQYGNMFWRNVTTDAVKFKSGFYAFNKAIKKYSGKSYTQFKKDALQNFKHQTATVIVDADSSQLITMPQKNNVVDYLYPQFVQDDTLIVSKQSYKAVSSFYLITNNTQIKVRVKDVVLDEYFSYKNGKIVYAAHVSNPRWYNQSYSDIRVVDIYTHKQTNITHHQKYFSPDINQAGTEVLTVTVLANGSNYLHRLQANTGKLLQQLPNTNNYFYTQPKYVNDTIAVAAVRNVQGQMALVLIHLHSGITTAITPFSFDVVGYPYVKNEVVYFTKMDAANHVDKIFAVQINTGQIYAISNNSNGVYHPTVNNKGDIVYSAFTNKGMLLKKIHQVYFNAANVVKNVQKAADLFTVKAPIDLANIQDSVIQTKPYKKSFKLFNFHSARPFATDPEFGYIFYSNNIVSTSSSTVKYTYNRNEQSSTIDMNHSYADFYSFLQAGAAYSFNRNIDTALGKGIQFNTAKLYVGASLPLQFIGGKTSKYFTAGLQFNIEQIPYIGITKNVFNNLAFKYTNSYISFSNISRQAKQHINPRWAQAISIQYRHAHTLINNKKLNINSAFYFPGFSKNHSVVANFSYQGRDTLQDFFSNNFAFARGYQALNSRQMFKVGINYHFTLGYIEAGVGNIFFMQRLRAATFFDYNYAKAKVNGVLTNIINKSTGVELYIDGKIWNALPASIGIRYSHLLDTDLRNPTATGLWEIILPINLINQ